jgi:hypothetical protein
MGTDDGWMGGRGPTVGFVSRLQRNRVYFHPHATMKRSANTKHMPASRSRTGLAINQCNCSNNYTRTQ